jgi:D-inositol-3-phosphate glycosyltransferase
VALISLHTSPLARAGVGDAGGMNVYLRAVSQALTEIGCQVDVYTRATSAAEAALGSQPLGGATLHHLVAGPAEVLPKEDLPKVAQAFAAAMAERAVRSDLIHSHYWLSGLAGRSVASAWRVPHVQSLHTVAAMKNRGLAPGDQPEGPQRLAAERALALGAARVVGVSDAERDGIVRDYGVARDRVTVISPGVDPAVFNPAVPLPQDLPPELCRQQGYLLMVGRVQPIKGQDLAIRALAHLEPWQRPALLVTGAPGNGHLDYAAGLRQLVRDLDLTADVVFTGPQPPDRLAQLIKGGRATLLPSWSETFGLLAVESAAVGTPVIASDTTGLRSSVAHGVSGLLIGSRRPAAWAAAIRRLLEEPDLAKRLSAGGARLGRERTWAHVATALFGVYSELVSAARRATLPARLSPAACQNPGLVANAR